MLCIAYASAYANKELKQARTATSLRGYLYGGGPALLGGISLLATEISPRTKKNARHCAYKNKDGDLLGFFRCSASV